MTDKANSIVNIQSHDKAMNKPVANAYSILGKTYAQTLPIIATGGIVALFAIWVIAASSCGGSVNFKLIPLEFQLMKGNCSIPADVGKK